ncbi:MAG: beta-lactamase family protein [Verrucomicrobiales bacterium]|nr:beta-lactamase family protein [Verrucomicrobiales bacterium]
MSILRVCVALLIPMVAWPGGAPAGAGVPRDALDAAVASAYSRISSPGVAVGVWMPGGEAYLAARGVADPVSGAAMTGDEHFRIGSITKTFTVTAILQLADEGRLSLDDPVGRHLPWVPGGDRITLRMLANMTSGLPSYTADEDWVRRMISDPARVYSPRELVEVALRLPLRASPGERWEYINTNTVLLGLVIEAVTGGPVAEFFQERIFKPLGLDQTSWPIQGALPDPLARGITRQTLDDSVADATHRNPSWAFTAGQLVSNRRDLGIWAKACATGVLVSPRLQKERLTWVTLPPNTATRRYGLGIGENHGWLGHTGELPGYNVSAFYLPGRDITLVVLANSDIPKEGSHPTATVLEAVTRVITPDHILAER